MRIGEPSGIELADELVVAIFGVGIYDSGFSNVN